MKEIPIRVEETYNASVNTVWAAITALPEMRLWYFDNIPAFEPVVGFETQFPVNSEDRVFTHIWKITEVIANKKITYNWSFTEYPGNADVTFELFEEINKTRLVLANIVIIPFPADVPEFKRESGVAGWNYLIKESLKAYLESKK